MSELGGASTARTSNGARGSAPVPAAGGGAILTPTQIMNRRNARDAARREEEQRRQAEQRRQSAERRAATVPGGAAPRASQASSQYSPDAANVSGAFDGAEHRRSRTAGEVATSNVLGDPTGRAQQDFPPSGGSSARPRGASASQSDQPRVPAAGPGTSRRTTLSQAVPRQPVAATTGSTGRTAAPTSTSGQPSNTTQRTTPQSSFPHAFERWEDLSAHWEGLTSYWLHKLEQNTEEIRETIPNASTLSRQITDLSAAGANLFHAVVELQRLRASSERKFQRWFYDTRGELERHREVQAGLERQVENEKKSRDSQRADNSIAVENAKREVMEMRRELMISKDEARRAWEELGRRNQESLDTAQSLKEGKVTSVNGVQVLPYYASRTGSASQRPGTQDGRSGYGSVGPGGGGDERDYYRQVSPSNTDPFTEQQSLHHEPGTASLSRGTYSPYGPVQGTPASAATAQTAIPAGTYSQSQSPSQYAGRDGRTPTAGATSPEAQRFYQQAGSATYLHSPQTSTQNVAAGSSSAPTGPARREDSRSEGSFVDTLSEGDTEYQIDAQGRFARDAQGQPIPFRRQPVRSSESGDDFESLPATARREGEHIGGTMLPEAPAVPSTAAQAMATYAPAAPSPADYSGEGYGGWEGYSRAATHHHPTRLSDVLEEEEERSSRRTAD